MEPKKSPEADLETKRGIYSLIGLVVALTMVLVAIEWKTYERRIADLGELEVLLQEDEVIVTKREQKPPPPPPPPEQITVVENEVELEEELIMESTETSQDEIIEIVEEEEESDEVLSFAIVENKPIFPGCENEKTEEDRSRCFQMKLQQHIISNFKYPEMARTLGIQGKVFINFIIEKDGSIASVSVAKSVDPLLDEAALNAVKSLNSMKGKIQPAKQRGKPARMQFTIPVNARLQ